MSEYIEASLTSIFNPDLIFLVGVAGGLKDASPGDGVASTRIYQYASGKENEKHFLPRATIGLSTRSLIQRAMPVVEDAHLFWGK